MQAEPLSGEKVIYFVDMLDYLTDSTPQKPQVGTGNISYPFQPFPPDLFIFALQFPAAA
jgi:hypothetical protein